MVIISRKKNQSIVISDDIIVTVIEVRGDKVRLGIHLSKGVPLHRRDIFDALQQIDSQETSG